MTPMTDLSAIPDADLVAEWHHLRTRGQTLGVRTDLAAVELELANRSWYAPCAEEPKR